MGAFLLVFGSILNFVSFSFASQAMLAGLVGIITPLESKQKGISPSRDPQKSEASYKRCTAAPLYGLRKGSRCRLGCVLICQGSVQFVSNVVFVRFVLGERITKKTIVATMVILGTTHVPV